MIRNWLRRFMIGRYGPDALGVALFVIAGVLGLLSNIRILRFLLILSYAALFFAIFRLLSRNIVRRRAENDRFLTIWWPLKQRVANRVRRFRDRKNYTFFHCPACKNVLRVPKNKGKIQITCPKCGERFIRKT